ncbi:MAG: hypothetical protein P4K98_09660 [Bryobacteraceae bacterium]|nr:hypothetical protein [Bryobacteraceae bacterium]
MFRKLIASTIFFNEEGQDIVEYALLLGFVALASVAAFTTLNTDIGALWTAIAAKLADAN